MPESRLHLGTREGYDRWSGCYDDYANPLIVLEEPEMRDVIGAVHGLEVLDLASGTGRHALRMAAEGARVTGVDFSPGMLSVAAERSRELEVHWLRHDLHDPLPFARASFDRVVHGLGLDHLDDPVALLREVRRVLRPGGRAAVSLMHPAMFLKGTQARFVDPGTGELVVIENRRYSIADLVNAVRDAGMELVDIRERACTAEIARRIPRASKYVDWPMLLVLGMAPFEVRRGE